MFIYAWCAYPTITWVAQAIGIVLFTTAAFVIYNGVFSYLADWSVSLTSCHNFLADSKPSYGPFASSALAGQSLASMSI